MTRERLDELAELAQKLTDPAEAQRLAALVEGLRNTMQAGEQMVAELQERLAAMQAWSEVLTRMARLIEEGAKSGKRIQ